MANKILDLKDEINALEERKATLRVDVESLELSIKEKSESLADIRKRITATGGDYGTIESEHIRELDTLDSRVKGLRAEVETKEKSVKDLSDQYNSITSQIPEVTAQLDKAKKDLEKLELEITTKTEELNQTIIALDRDISDKRSELKFLNQEIKEAKTENARVTKDTEEKLESVAKEERLLSLKKRDIDIYEDRLRKKYPEETIIL